jgi:hypothetical protein
MAMLVSFWWLAVAFILGGMGGVMALAVLSLGPAGGDGDGMELQQVSHTQ